MSTYKGIFGKTIKHLSSDPDNSTYEGQIWYNTTEGKFKTVVALSAFVSSSPYPTAIFGNMGAGTQTAALSFGGTANPSTPSSPLTLTQEYNGSGWTAGGSMSQKRRSGIGFGIQTAALGSTGYTYPETNKTEEYDGSSWTAGGDYPVSQELGGGCGTQTAGLACGGGPGPSPSNISNEYDGSSWTASPGTLNTARKGLTVTGTQTAGLAASSTDSPTATACEEYNGSTWTTVNSMNTSRANVSFGSGIQTASILYSTPGSLESYDGTNWTNDPATMGTARNSGSSAGTSTASLACCGSPGSFTSLTEEYNFTANTITAAAWSSGGAINTARNSFEGVGLKNAALIYGGYGTPNVKNETESYDGTTWTEVNNLSTARSHFGNGEAGTQTAAIIFKGNTSASDTSTNATEEWDGTNWTSGTANPTVGQRNMGAGSQTSALSFGGLVNPAPPAPRTAATQEYDGSSWTTGGDLNTARNDGGGAGTQTAALAYGGDTPPSTNATEEYNGSTWTNVNNMVYSSGYYASIGKTQTDVMAAGNLYSSSDNEVQVYDGTSWSTRANLTTGRFAGAGAGGSSSSALVAGGGTPASTTATEEFTGETTSINIESVDNS